MEIWELEMGMSWLVADEVLGLLAGKQGADVAGDSSCALSHEASRMLWQTRVVKL